MGYESRRSFNLWARFDLLKATRSKKLPAFEPEVAKGMFFLRNLRVGSPCPCQFDCGAISPLLPMTGYLYEAYAAPPYC